jgi:urease gamma subunit
MVLENQGGRRIDFAVLGPRRAQGMLQQVQRLIQEHRRSADFHRSQQDPAYLQLVIMEQALQARVSEQSMGSGVTPGPETQRHIDSATRKGGKGLTPDEQAAVTSVATLKKEEKKPARMVREQSELQQAQVVLAAQDMIDRVQGMLEDISEMQFKDLPALADSVKNDMGVEQSTQFQSAASAAFTNLLQAVQAGKTELESAQGMLTGQAPQIPGQDTMAGAQPGAELGAEPGGDIEADLDLDVNLPPEEPEPETPAAALGRERR